MPAGSPRRQLLSAEAALHDGHHHDHVDQVLAIKKAYPHVKSAIENMLASYAPESGRIRAVREVLCRVLCFVVFCSLGSLQASWKAASLRTL